MSEKKKQNNKLSEQTLTARAASCKWTLKEAVWPHPLVYLLLGSACQSCNAIGTSRYGLNSLFFFLFFFFGPTVELIEGNPAHTVDWDCITSAR